MHLNCCDWAGVTTVFTIQVFSNCFEYFFPLTICSVAFYKKFGLSRKPLPMFQVARSHAGHCTVTPREAFPRNYALHLLLTSQVEQTACLAHVQGMCSDCLLGAVKWRVRKYRRGVLRWVVCTEDLVFLMHLVAHTILQETRVFPCSHKVVWLQYSKPSSPASPCFTVIGLQPVPWGWRKILRIFFLITAPLL